jgi:hypothetical protein
VFIQICILPCFFSLSLLLFVRQPLFLWVQIPFALFLSLLLTHRFFFGCWLFVQICFFSASGLLPTPRHSPQPLFLSSVGSGGRNPHATIIRSLHSSTRTLSCSRWRQMASSLPAPAPAEILRRNRILSSKLYLDVPLSKVGLRKQNNLIFSSKETGQVLIFDSNCICFLQARLVYSPAYDVSFMGKTMSGIGVSCSRSPWGLVPCWAAQSSTSSLFSLLIFVPNKPCFS